ncbi:MAG: hypothetical protein HY321_02450 [Armatimonadetes bacterium]|nr:hypothetical protein [Armatimonadota bacterium]
MPGMMPGMDGTGMPGGMPGMMPGMDGTGMPGGMPGMMPGMMGLPGAGTGQPTMRSRQRYLGLVAGMMPEQFAGWLMGQSAQGGMLGTALAPGAPADPMMGLGFDPTGGAGPPPGMNMMGVGGPAMPGGVPGAGQPGAQTTKLWIYQRSKDGVTYMFSFGEEGRVSLICVGDDKPYSTPKGGKTAPFAGALTSKGIGLGDTFKEVILKYGYPEGTEVIGDMVLLKYLDRHGVAFTFRQIHMKVDSITVKSPEE